MIHSKSFFHKKVAFHKKKAAETQLRTKYTYVLYFLVILIDIFKNVFFFFKLLTRS